MTSILYKHIKILVLFLGIICALPTIGKAQNPTLRQLEDSLTVLGKKYASVGDVKIKKIVPNNKLQRLTIITNDAISYLPLRPENVKEIYDMATRVLRFDYPNYSLTIFSDDREISELVPGYFRKNGKNPYRRFQVDTPIPLTQNTSLPNRITEGLQNKHIALWQSHGLYYNQNKRKWMWQRPQLFHSVEDLFTQSFVLPFLVPMLENAGANVLLPRERNTELHEVIVDNDRSTEKSEFRINSENAGWQRSIPGFANRLAMYSDGDNPFRMGSYLQKETTQNEQHAVAVSWIPDIPEAGEYGVYVSYKTLPNSVCDAHYTIFHQGGKTTYLVNQTMGGGTWIYLGKFVFPQGANKQFRIELTNYSKEPNKTVTADAIKIGGGWGNIARKKYGNKRNSKGSTSRMPRFTEGARYWLQWAGVPDSVYSRTEGKNDYSDDFQSRGFWVNYLAGGSSVLPTQDGLRIPIDMALAMHSDAGINKNDSIIGTLAIFTVKNSDKKTQYKNGISRRNAREYADIIQTQIVNDIRAIANPAWNRRGLWNRNYSESRVGEVPTMLLEILSHQNFRDMQFGLDPRFRFLVSRAIYKGMLRYLATVNHAQYTIQPLPIRHFSTQFSTDSTAVMLQWKATPDPLEPSAMPNAYIVYTRKNNGGFDNGVLVKKNSFTKKIAPDTIYSFKVEAVNEGGRSFPSEVLSVCRVPNNNPTVLIVNGFTRISAPLSFKVDSTLAGFNDAFDAGVPYLTDINFIGSQYEFRRNVPYKDNENPGFGASNTNFAHKEIAGNSFDYSYLHGKSIREAGFSFVSSSKSAILSEQIRLSDYEIVDLILGKERSRINPFDSSKTDFRTFEPQMQNAIIKLTDAGGNILITGSNVVSDLVLSKQSTNNDKVFMEDVLKVKWGADKINNVNQANFYSTELSHEAHFHVNFYHYPNSKSYFVEAPDWVKSVDKNAFNVCQYQGSGLSGGVAYKKHYGVCVLGFPFETIEQPARRDVLMKNILTFFTQ